MKCKHFLLTVIFIVVFILSVRIVWAQVPQTMSYQGVLMKAKGTLVQNGQYTLTFKLYDAAEGGQVLWSETQTIRVEDGLFNAALGSMNSLDIPFDQPYWLAVTIGDGEEVSRRMQLTSSAYSLQAQTVADKAITSKKIADGQVVRSINSVTDNVKLTAGENVTITQEGDELVISANSRKGDELVTLAKVRTKGPDQGAPESVVESLVVNGPFGVKDPTSGNFTLVVKDDSVGIGTTNPARALEVVANGDRVPLRLKETSSSTSYAEVKTFDGSNNDTILSFYTSSTVPNAVHKIRFFRLTNTTGGVFLDVFKGNNTLDRNARIAGNGDSYLAADNGNVGIGTSTPNTLAHIGPASSLFGGLSDVQLLTVRSGQNMVLAESVGSATDAGMLLATGTSSNDAAIFLDDSDGQKLKFATGNVDFDAGRNSNSRMVIDQSGNVGIGTTSPNEQLEITGNFRLPATTATTGIIRSDGDLLVHTFGADNFFAGVNAGNLTMSGIGQNTGVGKDALLANTTGDRNTALGWLALTANTTGVGNTATGRAALVSNISGDGNTASGRSALFSNTSGSGNTAFGHFPLGNNTTGSENTALGRFAGNNNMTGSQITALGFQAEVSVDGLTNATAIGANAVVDASNKIRLGDANITVLECQVGLTIVSDETKKENFLATNGEETLEKLSQFKLGSWNFKGQDSAKFRHYGPMAQEFFKAFGHDDIGTIGNSTTISTSDLDGVMMIAIQALEKRTAELQTKTNELANLQAEFDKMNQRMTQLAETLQRFAAAKPAGKEETQTSAASVSEPR